MSALSSESESVSLPSRKNVNMLTDNSLAVFKAQLKFSYYTTFLPYFWIPGRKTTFTGNDIIWGKLTYDVTNLKRLKWWKARIWLFWSYSIYLILLSCYILAWGHDLRISVTNTIAFYMWVIVHSSISMIGVTLTVKHGEICALMNQILAFWRNNFYKYEKKQGHLHWILLFWLVSTPFIPIILPMFFWLSPCSPQFLYALVTNSCETGEHNFWVQVIFYFFEVFMISPAAAFAGTITMMMIIGLTSLNEFLYHIRHLGTLNQRIKDRTKWYEAGVKRQAMLYRQVQLLVHVFNECFKDYQMPNVFIVHAACNVICLFAIIELRETLPLAEFISYPFFLALCVSFDVIIMEYANRPQTLSKAVKMQWKQRQFIRKDLWLMMFSKSCPIQKIYTKPTLPVGRQRLAIFLRFCLQRSFFLAVYHRRLNGIL